MARQRAGRGPVIQRVWLASYPKSGNTWLRLLLANIGQAEPVSINGFGGKRGGIASARDWFERALHLSSGLLTHDECDALRPLMYAAGDPAAAARPPAPTPVGHLSFCKVHDAYHRLTDGRPLLGGAAGALAAVLIVRDPRDVAASFANHLGRDIDHAIRVMADPSAGLCDILTAQRNQLRQRLSSWSGHAASWLKQQDVPVHLVSYEALHRDPVRTLIEALGFCGVSLDVTDAARAVSFADFDVVRTQEEREGFREAPSYDGGSGRFFRSGRAGGWREELTDDQARAIERAHGAMMRRLGYDLCFPEIIE